MRAMILAAGRGERMKPLTDVTAKPLLQVGGRSLIEHHLVSLAAAGCREVVINLAWKGALIREALGDGSRYGLAIEYSDEGDAALETGGGIFKALSLLGTGPFLVVSGDVWTDYPFGEALQRLSEGDLAHFVLVRNPEFHRKGDFGLQVDRVVDADPRLTYSNIGVFRREFFAECTAGRFALAPVMFEKIRAGRVSGELFEGRWCNVGTPAQLAALNSAI
jgi:MurNAc alpha-1-phosphate uridylyltransferase